MRQVYYSLILSRWFKLRFSGKSGTYSALINTRNLTNLTSQKPWDKGEYFNQYQQSFAKGEYNLKEQVYTPTGQSVRSYVSGGLNWASSAINTENGVVLKGDVSNTPGMLEISGSANSSLNIGLQPVVAGSSVKARVENKLKELKNNSGLPILTTLDNMPEGALDNALWAQTLRALQFSEPIYRRVEKEGKAEERYTGQPAFTNADADVDIKQLTVYDVSKPELYSIRKGEDVRGFIFNPDANIPPEAYFMHRGIFASKTDIQKAFYDNKIRFDITIIPPAIWGADFAKTVGHYHDPVEKPEIYQVVSGDVLWLMQKCDEQGNVVDFIAVRAKAGDIAIMLPGYGHVSVNLSETEPLVMADWLTWHQSSYYGSFKEKKGVAYYVIKNNQGQPELIPNEAYLKTQGVLPQPRQMVSKDEISAFGLKRGIPIYNLVKLSDQEFKQKVEFLNEPQRFANTLTPAATLNPEKSKELMKISGSLLEEEVQKRCQLLYSEAEKAAYGDYKSGGWDIPLDKFIEQILNSIRNRANNQNEIGIAIDIIFGKVKVESYFEGDPHHWGGTVYTINTNEAVVLSNDQEKLRRLIDEIKLRNSLNREIDILWQGLKRFEETETRAKGYYDHIHRMLDIEERVFKSVISGGLLSVVHNEQEALIGLKIISDRIIKSPAKGPVAGDHHIGYLHQGSIDTSKAIALAKDIDSLRRLMNSKLAESGDGEFDSVSSSMQSLPDKKTGGIDLRGLPMTIQPMGSFRGLDFGLPRLSRAEIERIDVESQIGQIKNMVSSGISPSGRRVKELVAACAQKGQISAYADDLLACIGDILKLEEETAKESSVELKEALVLADLGGNYFQL